MRIAVGSLLLLAVLPSYKDLAAQCPDGSAPPCRRVAAPVAVDSNAVAILPFKVSGPPDAQYLSEGMLDLLNVALDGFTGWRVIQPRAFLRQVGTEASAIDVARAAQFARQAGAATFVLGNVVALGPELRVQAELYESGHGTSLGAVRARGTLALPAPVADTIAGGLARQRVARYPGIARRPLAEYTTTSPAALQEYLVAEQLARHAAWQEAAESLSVALGRDSTFALAYYALYRATTWGNAGSITAKNSMHTITPHTIDEIIQAAIRHIDRAPPRQRRLLEFVAAVNRADALRRADGLAHDYPDDADAWLERGDAYFHIGLQSGEPPTVSLESLERAIALDPGVPEAYLHVVQLRSLVGDSAGAWQALTRLRSVAPLWNATVAMDAATRAGIRHEDPATIGVRDPVIAGQIARYVLWVLDPDPARGIAIADSFASLAANSFDSPSDRAIVSLRRHLYRLAEGRWSAAWDQLQAATRLDPTGPEVLGATVLHHIVTGAHEREAEDAAHQLVARRDTVPLWASTVVAWRQGARGAPDSVSAALRALQAGRDYPEFRAALADGLAGLVALRAGDTAAALPKLVRANTTWIELRDIEEYFPSPYLALLTARLDARAGDLAGASRHLAETIGPLGILFRAEAEELRGRIGEQLSDTAAAVRAYRNFTEMWKDADPELQPRVATARAALTRLER